MTKIAVIIDLHCGNLPNNVLTIRTPATVLRMAYLCMLRRKPCSMLYYNEVTITASRIN